MSTLRSVLARVLSRVPGWIRWSLLALAGALVLLLVWGAGIEPRLIFTSHEIVQIPGLPQAWHGQRIALIADPQVGIFLSNTSTVRRIVERLVELRPAAVFIAGDFIYHPLEDEPEEVREDFERDEFSEDALDELRAVIDLLRPLQAAGIPTYAVLGNHDYGLRSVSVSPLPWLAAQVRQQLESIGIRVLQNEAMQLALPQSTAPQPPSDLWVVGFGPHLPNKDLTGAALSKVPDDAPRVVLMHNPATFETLPAHSAPLAMAGHTHGGQVRLPWNALRRLLGRIKPERSDLSGWIDDYGQAGNRLYINRGIGFSRFPIRINCPPEITIFTLRSAGAN